MKNINQFCGLYYVFFITRFIPVLHVLAPLQLTLFFPCTMLFPYNDIQAVAYEPGINSRLFKLCIKKLELKSSIYTKIGLFLKVKK